MNVSPLVHYGLRAMTELARSYGEERLVSISEIARSEDLPLAYLEQLVGELRRSGLVEGTAEDYLPGSCGREPVCLSRSIWDRVQHAILAVLDSTTLDDLLKTEVRRGQAAAHFVPLDALSASSPSEYAH